MALIPIVENRLKLLGSKITKYQGLEYSDKDIADFKERLERIHDRSTHRVQVLDFEGIPVLMRDVLYARMQMEHRDGDGVVVFTSQRDISTDEDFLGPPLPILGLEIRRVCYWRKEQALSQEDILWHDLAEHFRLQTKSVLSSETLGLGYPQNLLDRRAMQEALLSVGIKSLLMLFGSYYC
ncbi:hypothetical protein Tco_1102369 [Tanacetum coccineum]